MFSTTRIAEELNISAQTVRERARAFAEFLSQGATRAGARLVFDERDVAIMRRIHELSDGSRSYEEIHPVLAAEIAMGNFEDVSSEEIEDAFIPERPMSLSEVHETIGRYQRALQQAEARARKAETELAERNELVESLREEIVQLREELAHLRGRMEAIPDRTEEVMELRSKLAVLQFQLEQIKTDA
ncbi:MAG: hypothetical protein ACFB51_21270 [Anaerolineae bacterium]